MKAVQPIFPGIVVPEKVCTPCTHSDPIFFPAAHVYLVRSTVSGLYSLGPLRSGQNLSFLSDRSISRWSISMLARESSFSKRPLVTTSATFSYMAWLPVAGTWEIRCSRTCSPSRNSRRRCRLRRPSGRLLWRRGSPRGAGKAAEPRPWSCTGQQFTAKSSVGK